MLSIRLLCEEIELLLAISVWGRSASASEGAGRMECAAPRTRLPSDCLCMAPVFLLQASPHPAFRRPFAFDFIYTLYCHSRRFFLLTQVRSFGGEDRGGA